MQFVLLMYSSLIVRLEVCLSLFSLQPFNRSLAFRAYIYAFVFYWAWKISSAVTDYALGECYEFFIAFHTLVNLFLTFTIKAEVSI